MPNKGFGMLRVIRPEAGEEYEVFFDLIQGHQTRKSAKASLLVAEVLMNPANPEAGEERVSVLRHDSWSSDFKARLLKKYTRLPSNPLESLNTVE